MPYKKQAREGLVSTKLHPTQMEQVEFLCVSTGMHVAHVVRGLIDLGIRAYNSTDKARREVRLISAGSLSNKDKSDKKAA